MGMNLAEKLISPHLGDGKNIPGEEIAIRIDQTLTSHATGTLSCLQFEAFGLKKVRTELSVSYVDHKRVRDLLNYTRGGGK